MVRKADDAVADFLQIHIDYSGFESYLTNEAHISVARQCSFTDLVT